MTVSAEMTAEPRLSSATRASFNRSKVTNGSILPGIDLRSSAGRRFKDLIEEYSKDIAPDGALSSVETGLVRQAAAITVRAEALQADIVSGVDVKDDTLVRLTNSACRILLALTKTRKGKPRNALPSIAEHFAKKRAAAA